VSQDDLFGAPAGWYPDPLGLPQLRWWNNHAWTEQTSAARQPMVMQDTKFAWADDELPTRREERERERTRSDAEGVDTARPTADTLRQLDPPRAFTKITESEPEVTSPVTEEPKSPRVDSLYQPDPIVEPTIAMVPPVETVTSPQPAAALPDESLDALFGAREARPASPKVQTPIIAAEPIVPATQVRNAVVSTGPAWIIAMIPLFQLVLSLLFINFGFGDNPALFIGILAAPYFLVFGLAVLDYRLLKAGGNPKPAHWAWAILTAPVYLLMRARSVISQSGKGIGPVLVWCALAFLHVASVIAIPGLVISVAPGIFTPQIEQSVARDAQLISGTQLTVTCPAAPPVLIGQQVVCHSQSSSGSGADITVSLSRSNGWIAWQVVDWGVFTMQR
jgi:Protein of unknown function (DUF2510)